MQSILRQDITYCTPYMDYIVIFSNSWKEHVVHIKTVLTKLRKAGLTANPDKCRWGGQLMEFLGHLLEGKMMLPAHRAEALSKYSKPVTKKGLRAFLGTIGFYRHYVELLASQTAILTPLTAKQALSKVVWTTEGKRAFSTICETISNSCALCTPLP